MWPLWNFSLLTNNSTWLYWSQTIACVAVLTYVAMLPHISACFAMCKVCKTVCPTVFEVGSASRGTHLPYSDIDARYFQWEGGMVAVCSGMSHANVFVWAIKFPGS